MFSLGGIGAGGFGRDRIFGRKADLMLVEWAWRGRRRVLLCDGVIFGRGVWQN